ncbi:MAG: hypothetical protein WD651_09505 [Acidimicrobiia bacterium]
MLVAASSIETLQRAKYQDASEEQFAAELCPHMPIDPGIVRAVRVLTEAGIETYESCEGGEGHAFLEPTVRFFGGQHEGWRALAALQVYRLPVYALRRFWSIQQNEPVGPNWELTFRPLAG